MFFGIFLAKGLNTATSKNVALKCVSYRPLALMVRRAPSVIVFFFQKGDPPSRHEKAQHGKYHRSFAKKSQCRRKFNVRVVSFRTVHHMSFYTGYITCIFRCQTPGLPSMSESQNIAKFKRC